MTNEVKVFSNGKIDLPVKEIDGQVYFDAEVAAIGLGISVLNGQGLTNIWASTQVSMKRFAKALGLLNSNSTSEMRNL